VALLREVRAPRIVEYLVALLVTNSRFNSCFFKNKHDGCEYFSGQEALSRSLRKLGFNIGSFDIKKNHRTMNINNTTGFIHGLVKACTTKPGGFGHLGIVCSSWVFMSSGTSKRSIDRPHGDLSQPSVRRGNKMVARSMIFFWIFKALCCWAMVEQPQGSVMQHYKRFQRALAMRLFRLHIWMGEFGARTVKGTWLYSTHKKLVKEIQNHRTRRNPACNANLVKKTNRHGERQVTANQKELKKSQTYPIDFGRAVAKVYRNHRRTLQQKAARVVKSALKKHKHIDLESICKRDQRLWKDAKLKHVVAELRARW